MTTTTDIRNEVHAGIRPSVRALQGIVWELLGQHGPCTTRQLSERSAMSIFTVRPRVTELLELGMVELVGREGREGVYRQVELTAVQSDLNAEAAARGEQRLLL